MHGGGDVGLKANEMFGHREASARQTMSTDPSKGGCERPGPAYLSVDSRCNASKVYRVASKYPALASTMSHSCVGSTSHWSAFAK